VSHRRKKQLGPALVTRVEPAIAWRDYARIAPRVYSAYCRWARHYRDRGYKRWTCLLRFDVLSDDLMRVVARLPLWMNLGQQEQPQAGRRSRYFVEWVRANGGPPTRQDRLSPRVFKDRLAKVEVGDSNGDAPYSVVRKILSWETGAPRRVTQSASHTVKAGSWKQHS
jgi:hypothetical protein